MSPSEAKGQSGASCLPQSGQSLRELVLFGGGSGRGQGLRRGAGDFQVHVEPSNERESWQRTKKQTNK